MRVKQGLAVMLLLLVGVLAACGGKQEPSSAGGQAGQAKEQVLKIGAAVSLTGALSAEGKYVRDGYDFWRDTVNKNGGIKIGDQQYKVEIIYYDDQSNSDTASKLTEKLITEDGVKFILGPFGSGISSAATTISEKYQVINIPPMASSDKVYARGYKYLFGILPLSSTNLNPIFDMLKIMSPAPRTVAIITPDDLLPLTVAEAAREYATSVGMEVVLYEKYPKDAKDFSALVSQVKAKNPDVWVGTGYMNDAVAQIRQAKELKFNPTAVVFPVPTALPQFTETLGADALNVIGSDWWTKDMAWTGPVFGSAKDYYDGFRAAKGYEPNYNVAGSSAAGLVLQLALEKAGTLDVNRVRDVLAATNTETFFGPIKYDSRGVNTAATVSVIQIQGGKPVLIWPEKIQKAKPVFPKPLWGN
ncbi:MAG TPA: amino acid ABC transporter substrate-binding protein [Symbiobacteriaceae bacterium]|nr:amino acid ABC transporter substrate-binding protein [Symbiobacteriaceae bacterium]